MRSRADRFVVHGTPARGTMDMPLLSTCSALRRVVGDVGVRGCDHPGRRAQKLWR